MCRTLRDRIASAPARAAWIAGRFIAARRFDWADRLLEYQLDRTPHDFGLLEQFAYSAHNSGRYAEALRRWGRLRDLRPGLAMAWCGVASNARELGQINAASEAITEALGRFPDDLVVISEAARIRERQKNYAEAAELWLRIFERPPRAEEWLQGAVRNLLVLQRYDHVERVLATLPLKPGTHSDARRRAASLWSELTNQLSLQHGWLFVPSLREIEKRYGDEAFCVDAVAATTLNLSGAQEALRRILEDAPADREARESYVRILARADLIADAEREIEKGLQISPRHEYLRAMRGLLAMRQQDWTAAESVWRAYADAHPDDPRGALFVSRLAAVRELHTTAEPGPAVRQRKVPVAPGLHDDPELRRMMLAFESIGTTCEFGTVQRRFGAEPLSLLRWTDTSVATLQAAIAAGFARIGDAETTDLTVGPGGEIYIRDTRWHLAMHTFLYDYEVSLADLLPKMRRRTAYLRDKFLDEVREGAKILVFKDDSLSDDDLFALHDAFRRLGPVRLLHVRRPAASGGFPEAKSGTAIEIRDGLFVGRVSRSGVVDIAFDEWVEVCKSVVRLQTTARDEDDPDLALPVASAGGR